MKEPTLPRNSFSALGANENIEDFFEHKESHCVASKANPDQRLMLLWSLTTWDHIRRNLESLITHGRSWKDLMIIYFRDFRKPLPYWTKENWGQKLLDKILKHGLCYSTALYAVKQRTYLIGKAWLACANFWCIEANVWTPCISMSWGVGDVEC
jgi:hypothetical protein